MKINPGSVAIPLCLILAGAILALNRFGLIHIHNLWSLWPVILIASGMEKLYLWTITPNRHQIDR
jgi:hypothetical protein